MCQLLPKLELLVVMSLVVVGDWNYTSFPGKQQSALLIAESPALKIFFSILNYFHFYLLMF